MNYQHFPFPQIVKAEQVKLLYQNSAFALFAILLITPILSAFIWDEMDSGVVGLWLLFGLGITLSRFALLKAYSKQQSLIERASTWHMRFLLGVFASGLLWGLAGVFLDPIEHTSHWFLILFVMVGLAGGALATLSSDRFAYSIFVLPAFLPIAVASLVRGAPIDLAMGAMIFLFIVLTIIVSQRAHNLVAESINIRFDNTKLLERLSQANDLLGKMFDTTAVHYAYLDPDFNFIQVNQAFANAYGKTTDAFIGQNYFELFPSSSEKATFQKVLQDKESQHILGKQVIENGEKSYWNWGLQPILSEQQQMEGLLLSRINITEQKAVQDALREKEEYLRTIMETAVEAIITTDEKGVIEMANAAVMEVFGYKANDLIGKNINLLMAPNDRAGHNAAVRQYVSSSAPKLMGRKLTSHGMRADGTEFPIEVAISEALIGGRRIFTGVMRDISAERAMVQSLKEKNQELEFLSSHDALTGLYNRRMADQQLAKEWGRAFRSKSELAILIIDVDYFKAYNDTYGHQQGDECLRQLADTMHAQLRRPPDFLARYGGEEFIAILPETSLEGACQVAEHMRSAVEEKALPHDHSRTGNQVTISIGVASMCPGPDNRFEMAVSYADTALYQAKQKGRNQVACHHKAGTLI